MHPCRAIVRNGNYIHGSCSNVANSIFLKRSVRWVVPCLLCGRAVSEMLNPHRLVHPIRFLFPQITRVIRALIAEMLVLRHRGRNYGCRVLVVEHVHLVVFTQLCGLAIGLDVEEQAEESGETAQEKWSADIYSRQGSIRCKDAQSGDGESSAGLV